VLPQDSPTNQDFLKKVQQLLAGCQNEEHLLLKTTVIVDHLLNQYCQSGLPANSGLNVPDMSLASKWLILQQKVKVPVHTSVCMTLLLQQHQIIVTDLHYSKFKLGRLLSTLSAKYPTIADHTRQSALLGAKYALTLFCCEVFACTG